MKQFSYAVIFAMIGGMVYILLNQEDKTTRNFEFIYSVELEASESPVKIWIPAPQNITVSLTSSADSAEVNSSIRESFTSVIVVSCFCESKLKLCLILRTKNLPL